jgi:hypothetical protein
MTVEAGVPVVLSADTPLNAGVRRVDVVVTGGPAQLTTLILRS